MKQLIGFGLVLCIGGAVSMSACGGIVSLGDPGAGKNGLTGDAATDSGSGPTVDFGSSSGGDLTGWPWWIGEPGGFPMPGPGGVDAGVDDSTFPHDALDKIVWMAWWPCDGAICTQNFQIVANCQLYWVEARTDRPEEAFAAGPVPLPEPQCSDFFAQRSTFDAMVGAPDPATPATDITGAEALHVMIGPSPGIRTTRRIEAFPVSGDPFGKGRKYVFDAYGLLPAGKSPLHFAQDSARGGP